MSEAELRGLVGWTVQDAPPEARVGRVLGGLLHAVSAVVTLGADAAGGARSVTWRVPAKVRRETTEDDVAAIRANAASYTGRIDQHRAVRRVQ